MTTTVLTVGDALIDHFLHVENASRFCEIKQDTHQVCFIPGSKIMVDTSEFCLGGNACNVAVGLARLGNTTALAAEIGDDEFSQKILQGLAADHIQTEFVKQTIGAQTTFSISLSFMGDRTNFIHHVPRNHDIAISSVTTNLIYLTSLGKEWKMLYAHVLSYKQAHPQTILAFNPGSHQLQEGRESFKDILAATDILFVNKEEAEEILYGTVQHTENKATTAETLVRELQKQGPHIICLTDGLNGSYCLDAEGNFYTQGLAQSRFVEKTGAGDAYASGFLGGLLVGSDISTAMKWGAVNSASVIEHIGAQKGLLTKEAITTRLQTL